MRHIDKGDRMNEQLFNRALGMELDKETTFSPTGLDNSEQLHHPEFMWCQNDSQTIQTCPHSEHDS
jgi:hypothetical protein